MAFKKKVNKNKIVSIPYRDDKNTQKAAFALIVIFGFNPL